MLLKSGIFFFALLQIGICQDGSRIRFSVIQKHAPNFPEVGEDISGTVIGNISDPQRCLMRCADEGKCDLFSYNSAKRMCYISDKESNLLSSGLFRDLDTTTYVMLREGTLRSFFFLDVAPVWPDYFIHEDVKTAQECSDICVRDAKFCIAFTFFPTNQTCRKYNRSIIHDKISPSQVVRRRDSNIDGMYFEKLLGNYIYFAVVIGYRIAAGTSVKSASCAEYCLTHESCIGFSQSYNGTCLIDTKMNLLDFISGRRTQLIPDKNSIYFEMWRTTGYESDVKYHTEGQITSPGFPIDYPPERRFVRLTSEQGMMLSASLTRMNIPINASGLCVDKLIINGDQKCNISQEKLEPVLQNGGQQSIDVNLISSNGTLANVTEGKYYGFRIEYEMSWNCSKEPISVTAGTLDRIFNPGFPRIKQSADCSWQISASPSDTISLFFGKLPSNTSLLSIFKDGEEVKESEYKDGVFGNNTVVVNFRASLATFADSFLIYYAKSNPTEYLSGQKDILCKDLCTVKSSDFIDGDLSKNSVINYRIDLDTQDYKPRTALSISFASLGFGHRDHFGDCQAGWIDVFEGRANQPLSREAFVRFCGTRPPQSPILIQDRSVTIIVRLFNKRYYDGSSVLEETELRGFFMTVNTGFKTGFYGESVTKDSMLSVTDGTSNYGPNLNTRWIIANTDDIVPRVSVEKVDLATIPGKPQVCDNDRLEVSVVRLGDYGDLTNVDRYQFCGRPTSELSERVFFASNQLPITVRFKSDDRHSAKGFRINVNYTRSFALQLSEGGFDATVVKSEGYIMSARFPEMVSTPFEQASASWIINSGNFTHFTIQLEVSSTKEPRKLLQYTYPNGEIKNMTMTPTPDVVFGQEPMDYLPNNTKITWIVLRNEQNRFAAKITFADYSGPPVTDGPPTGDRSSRPIPPGSVAGIIIGVLLVVLLFAGVAYYVLKVRQSPPSDSTTVNYNRHEDAAGRVSIGPSSQTNPAFQSDP